MRPSSHGLIGGCGSSAIWTSSGRGRCCDGVRGLGRSSTGRSFALALTGGHADHYVQLHDLETAIMISEFEMQDIAEIAATLIACAMEDGACGVISLFPGHGGDETQQAFTIVTDVRRQTPRGELLWIDEHLFDDDAARSEFFDALVSRLKPLVEGIEEHRFVRDEATDRLVVLSAAEPGLMRRSSHTDQPSIRV
jgi:hypothetical protein